MATRTIILTQQQALADVFQQVYSAHNTAEERCLALATISLISQECAVSNLRLIQEQDEHTAVRRELIMLKALAYSLMLLEETGLKRQVDEIVGMIDQP